MIRIGKKFSKPTMSRIVNGDIKMDKKEKKEIKERLDILAVKRFSEYNRSTLQKFITSGFIKVDGKVIKKTNLKFNENVKLELSVPEVSKNTDLEPKTIYEDEHVIVLDKPAGLLSMAKGEYCPEKTLEDYGLLVHRLDRGTSGVVILAKDKETQKFLRKQFQDRKTHKTYYAIVEGVPKLEAARIDLPIARDLKHPTTFRVDPSGKPSETYYRTIKSNNKYSLLELKPTTGRTHQLRVHLKYLGHPILGDPVYGNKEVTRLYLHAKELVITLPGGKRRTFEAKLPQEFYNVL
ncbi:RluA family pseudouridine synthase [Candidatus Saccharibacteria bacterium]|nr:RluA family pseudouridine synthase [Candidatus Saccharibacteria bacterium]